MSIIDRNGLFGVISGDGGGHVELDSVVQGLPELMISTEGRNADEVEENLESQIKADWFSNFIKRPNCSLLAYAGACKRFCTHICMYADTVKRMQSIGED